MSIRSWQEEDKLVAENIRRLRLERKLSQERLAAKLQLMGLNATFGRISMIERKQRPVPASLLVGIKVALNCTYEDLVGNLQHQFEELVDNAETK